MVNKDRMDSLVILVLREKKDPRDLQGHPDSLDQLVSLDLMEILGHKDHQEQMARMGRLEALEPRVSCDTSSFMRCCPVAEGK